jgi:thiamine pyrophosphokinase
LGLTPDLIIGDLDSIDPALLPKESGQKPQIIRYPAAKDYSDLELAVEHAVKLQPEEILIIGALGGSRVDHSLFNLMLLKIPLASGIPARIIDHRQELILVTDNLVIEGFPGSYVSLFPVTAEVEGLTTEGLKYPMHNDSLYPGSSRGLSNELIGSRGRVSISRGILLVIVTNKS